MSVQVDSRQPVMRAMTMDGRQVTVSRVKLSRPVPGGTDEQFAVDVAATPQEPAMSYGFNSQEDAERFVGSMGMEEFSGRDQYGNELKTQRQGLGVPQGLMQKLEDQQKQQPAGSVGNPTQLQPQSPPEDAGAPPTGKQEGAPKSRG